jgi:hypothetical protein
MHALAALRAVPVDARRIRYIHRCRISSSSRRCDRAVSIFAIEVASLVLPGQRVVDSIAIATRTVYVLGTVWGAIAVDIAIGCWSFWAVKVYVVAEAFLGPL